MAKLTAAQVRSIETVLYHLNRANQYLMREDVTFSIKKSQQTTTLDYVDGSGNVVYPVNKQIGSDIAGLEMGIEYLKNFLYFNVKDTK